MSGSQLGDFWKYRVADHRVIAALLDEKLIVLVVRVGRRGAASGIRCGRGEVRRPMEISIQIPDEVGERLHSRWQDLPRHALEALVIDAYRRDVLTAAEVQRILGLPSRHETDAFLNEAGADLGYTWQDLEEDLQAFREASSR